MAVETKKRHTEPTAGLPTVTIVGRPNVGKSTLFNRILGERRAIVSERPGVTRDRQFATVEWTGRPFLLADTGGLVEDPEQEVEEEVRRQVMVAIDRADTILFVVDAQTGVHPVDEHVAEVLRQSNRPVVLAVNKVDAPAESHDHLDFYRLGLGDPHPVSALSGKGSGDLLDEVVDALPERPEDEREPSSDVELAVIGKPNVGKSSFVNRLLGEERVIVHSEAGTTRDAIDTYLEYRDTSVCLIDTAGLRKQSRVEDEIEFYSRLRATAAIERADVCLLVVDSAQGVTNQDFRIGQDAWDAGCALVFLANKWDLVEEKGPGVVDRFAEELRERAAYLRWVPIVTTSAKTGQRVTRSLEIALEMVENRTRRVSTSDVNEVLGELVRRRQPPQGSRGDLRLYYGTQAAVEPPLFVLWSNRPDELPGHYLRYLENGFREAWEFEGTPIRIKVKKRT